jgi:hypothetical protein
MLIINADDFGLNPSVNRAIMTSFKLGLCSSTSIMANMPGFEEACELAHERRLVDHLGIHLVLRDGPALSEEMQKSPRLSDREGHLAVAVSSPIWTLETSEKYAVAAEVRTQIACCRARGIPLTHLDSHHHLHIRWAILGVVIAVAKSERIPFVRLAQNCRFPGSSAVRFFKWAVNRRIQRAGLSRTRYFAGLEDYLLLHSTKGFARKRQSLEVMIHPVYREEDVLTDYGYTEPLEKLIAAIDSYDQAVSYGGAQYHG